MILCFNFKFGDFLFWLQERDARREENIKFTCRCSFLEIYNEQILDLLNPSSVNLQVMVTNANILSNLLIDRSLVQINMNFISSSGSYILFSIVHHTLSRYCSSFLTRLNSVLSFPEDLGISEHKDQSKLLTILFQ